MGPPPVFFVSGAFGTGKTTLAPLVAMRLRECFVMDVDWLLKPLSRLSSRELHIDSGPEGALQDVWVAVAGIAAVGGRSTVIFSPCEPRELEGIPSLKYVGESHWLLLDCADDIIRARLSERRRWLANWTDESVVDAARMRGLGLPMLRTDLEPPEETADRIVAWVRELLTSA